MKLVEVVEGALYCVSVREAQIEDASVRVVLPHDVSERAEGGVKARVLEIVQTSNGRRKVQVECAYKRGRFEQRTEDHLDGTKTE